jgi:hypothetical protein
MATSSLYKDFVITTREEAKGFVDMLDSFDVNAVKENKNLASFYEPSTEQMKLLIKDWRKKKNA